MDISHESGGAGLTEAQHNLDNFWARALEDVKSLKMTDFRTQELPLARIKKIMKLDEDVKMISAEAPALFSKAAEFFISELTLRAWILAEENKRRTLQRNDIATAISKYDQFDFLIDIVPREEVRPSKHSEDGSTSGTSTEPVQYFFQVAQPQQGAGQIIQSPIQILTGNAATAAAALSQQGTVDASGAGTAPQIIQLQAPMGSLGSAAAAAVAQQPTAAAAVSHVQAAASTVSTAAAAAGGGQTIQLITQSANAGGEVQQVQLTPQLMQMIQAHLAGKQPNQPIIIQTSVDGSTSAQDSNSTQFIQQM